MKKFELEKVDGKDRGKFSFELKSHEWIEDGKYQVQGHVNYDWYIDFSWLLGKGEYSRIQVDALCQFELEGECYEGEYPGAPDEWEYVITNFKVIEKGKAVNEDGQMDWNSDGEEEISPINCLKGTTESLAEKIYDYLSAYGLEA